MTIVLAMSFRALAQKFTAAILALAAGLATVPVVEASVPANACDGPSMQMHGQSMSNHTQPAPQKNAPCNDMQNCICSLSCGMSASLSQQSLALPSLSLASKLAWSESSGGSSLSIKPSIPPPISVV